ncbi:hypothetical protein [Salinibaculum rarum]|uniref:hypothetical protein n=1 Tax=Salinibaculum rarum TaxID=3058903 RepID=UPI00265DD0A8|nr:hypothetical protein [Salinibaculum sp. KK48]
MDMSEPMKDSTLPNQEVVDNELTEELYQINNISLGEGAATCQVCGSSFCEGDIVTVYVFCPVGEVMFQVGYVICGDGKHEPPKEFTLGARELVVEGRVGWCSDVATQSSWPVLLAPAVVAVSGASTKSVRKVPSGDGVSVSVGEARRRADGADGDVVRGLFWGEQR